MYNRCSGGKEKTIPLAKNVAALLLLWLWLMGGEALALKRATSQPQGPRLRLLVGLSPCLVLSSEDSLQSGFGLSARAMLLLNEQIALGLLGRWSRHGLGTEGPLFADMASLALGATYILDRLPVLPYFQTAVGAELRSDPQGLQWGLAVQLGLGLEVQLLSSLYVGLEVRYHFFLLNPEAFPLQTSIRLRLGMVF